MAENALQLIEQTQRWVRRTACLLDAAATVLQADDEVDYGQDADLRKMAHSLALKAKDAATRMLEDMSTDVAANLSTELYELWSGVAMVCVLLEKAEPLGGETQVVCPEAHMLEHLADFAGRNNCRGLTGQLDSLAVKAIDRTDQQRTEISKALLQ